VLFNAGPPCKDVSRANRGGGVGGDNAWPGSSLHGARSGLAFQWHRGMRDFATNGTGSKALGAWRTASFTEQVDTGDFVVEAQLTAMFGTSRRVEAADHGGAARNRKIRTIPGITQMEHLAQISQFTQDLRGGDRYRGDQEAEWTPWDAPRDKGPPTITSYQIHLWPKYAAKFGTHLGRPRTATPPAKPNEFYQHEWYQVNNLWLLQRPNTIRRPQIADLLQWMGLTNTPMAQALREIYPCQKLSLHNIGTPQPSEDIDRQAYWHAPWDGMCISTGLCPNCTQAWDLLGQGWHLPSILTVMTPWMARSLEMFAGGPGGGNTTWGWEQPPHVCGEACYYCQRQTHP